MAGLFLLSKALEEGNRDRTAQLTTEALATGMSPKDIVSHGLQAGMGMVGEKFSSGEYFLPDMLMAARAMKAALEILQPLLEKSGVPTVGKVVIGTVEGDMHDIGKNVVTTFLRGNGFEVIDLGINVPDKGFIEKVREEKPDILGLSALLTTSMSFMGRVIKAVEGVGLRSSVKVIVGGAPVTQDFANSIGADGYARDGGEAAPLCRQLLGK